MISFLGVLSLGMLLWRLPVLVSKWGNSLAVRLPKALVEEMGLVEGDCLEIRTIDQNSLALTQKGKDKAFLLELRALQKPKPESFHWSRDEANQR